MKYGTVQFKKNYNGENLQIIVTEPSGPDREYTKENDYPQNGLFFHYPETMSAEEAQKRLLKKAREETYKDLRRNIKMLEDLNNLEILEF